MFDIGWQEIFIVAAIALVVVGPKDLPHVLRTVAKLVKKARKLVSEFQSGLDEVIREAGVDEIKQTVERGANFDMDSEVKKIIDPEGDLSNEMDMGEIEKELDTAGSSTADGELENGSSDNDDSNILGDNEFGDNKFGDNKAPSDSVPSSPNEANG